MAGACERHCGPPVGPWDPPLPGWVNIDAEERWRQPGLHGGGSMQGGGGAAARGPGPGLHGSPQAGAERGLWYLCGYPPNPHTRSIFKLLLCQNQMRELKHQSLIKPRAGPLLVRGHVSTVH